MVMTVNGLSPCKGGDCRGIDHAWCAPGRHEGPYDMAARDRDRARAGQHGVEGPRHRKPGPVLDWASKSN